MSDLIPSPVLLAILQHKINNVTDERIKQNYVTPQMFGAKGDGVTDDTQAIKDTLNYVKHEYYDKGGVEIVFPVPEKFYKITDTIDMSELWNVKISCPTAYGNQRQSESNIDENYKLIHWYGEENKPMILLDYTFSAQLENITLNGRNIAKYGFKIAKENSVSANKYLTLKRCSALYCSIGCSIGNTAEQTDDCPISLYDCYFEQNKICGLSVNSGNDSVKMFGGLISQNGSNNELGSNLYVASGEVSLFGVTSDGEPKKADIYHIGGGLTLVDYWSDVTFGLLYFGTGATVTRICLSSVRHYDGAMTRENTPTSIFYNGKAPLILISCSLYGDVKIVNGAVPKVVNIGTVFLNENAGFTGEAITNYNALVSIGCGDNKQGNFANGKNKSNYHAQHEINSLDNRPNTLKTVDNFAIVETLNKGSKAEIVMHNCYLDPNTDTVKSILAGDCLYIKKSPVKISIKYATATEENQSLALVDLFTINKSTVGSANGKPSIQLGSNKIMWESNVLSGSHNSGDIIINRNFNGSNNFCWVYTTNGEWIAK